MKAALHLLLCLALPWLLASCASRTPSVSRPATTQAVYLPPLASDVPVFDLKQLDQAPAPEGPRARPVYPFELKKKRIEGEAIIKFIVDTDGATRNIEISQASHPAFGKAAADAVSQWRFTPGIKNGQPVNTRLQIPISFNLNQR
jgi:TonB family protein